MTFGNVTIIGVGLIGGSIGKDLIELGLARRVTGCGHRQTSIDEALGIGAVQAATLNPVTSVEGADLVILATPVGLVPEMFRSIAPNLKPGCTVTDVGSSKSWIARTVSGILPEGVSFVPAHPIAGSEKRSVRFARCGLFRKALCVITPVSPDSGHAERLVTRLWESLGATVVTMTPAEHDRIFALVSHLPHAMAACLLGSIPDDVLTLAGRGLKDTTRVAGGDARLWTDIFLSNRDDVLASLDAFSGVLSKFRNALASKDAETVKRLLDAAAKKQDAF